MCTDGKDQLILHWTTKSIDDTLTTKTFFKSKMFSSQGCMRQIIKQDKIRYCLNHPNQYLNASYIYINIFIFSYVTALTCCKHHMNNLTRIHKSHSTHKNMPRNVHRTMSMLHLCTNLFMHMVDKWDSLVSEAHFCNTGFLYVIQENVFIIRDIILIL